MSHWLTGLSPMEASLGHQPPLFPSQEAEISVPSMQQHLIQLWNMAPDQGNSPPDSTTKPEAEPQFFSPDMARGYGPLLEVSQ